MKRYLVFGYDQYYPMGGLEDLQDSFDDEDEAAKFAESLRFKFVQLFDRVEGAELELDQNPPPDPVATGPITGLATTVRAPGTFIEIVQASPTGPVHEPDCAGLMWPTDHPELHCNCGASKRVALDHCYPESN